jgi:hypothetical protein
MGSRHTMPREAVGNYDSSYQAAFTAIATHLGRRATPLLGVGRDGWVISVSVRSSSTMNDDFGCFFDWRTKCEYMWFNKPDRAATVFIESVGPSAAMLHVTTHPN